MTKISAVVITKNEESNIKTCLESLLFCDEVIVVDDESIDKTRIIAEKYNTKVYINRLENFSSQRNFGLSKVNHEWVLFIDADEIVSNELKEEIVKKIDTLNINGFFIQRRDVFLGKKMQHGDLGKVSLMRLAKRNFKWVNDVHEVWEVTGKTSNLENPVIHNSHKNLSEFIEKIDQYSSLRAEELQKQKVFSSSFSIVFYPVGKFTNLFFIKLGFLDGLHGFVHAVFMSMYSFFVRGKLYQLNNERK